MTSAPKQQATSSSSPRPPRVRFRPRNTAHLRLEDTRNPNPRNPTYQRPGRFLPPESLLQSIDEAIEQHGSEADLRMIALRAVQVSRVPVANKLKLFIPAGQLARPHQLDEIMHALN
ncbi:hypothetical protein PsorP6_001184 [Peronosclerospora sorghi]|uniref:Uncharacterized protein n=1 Tax=Peronosclerospora sorghi TaxID=230839 RepID=A0ACC0WT85_9STRA|nr:hypothetical protein PsorP6_001184 [Peronosclerospora sorghi]